MLIGWFWCYVAEDEDDWWLAFAEEEIVEGAPSAVMTFFELVTVASDVDAGHDPARDRCRLYVLSPDVDGRTMTIHCDTILCQVCATGIYICTNTPRMSCLT